MGLAPLFVAQRMRGLQLKLLVDNRQLAIQGAETAERIRIGVINAHEIGDRIAILLSSRLGAMQSRRILTGYAPRIFDKESDAIDWLRGEAPGA